MLALIKEKWSRKDRIILTSSYIYAVTFLFFALSPLFIQGVIRFSPFFAVVPGPLFLCFVVVFGITFVYSISTVFYAFRLSTGYKRNQYKFILSSFIFGLFSGLMHFCAAYFKKELFPHDFLLIAYTGIIAYAIIKHRLMDISVAFTRTGIFIAVYTIVLGLPFLMGVWAKDWLIGIFYSNWWLIPLILLATLALVGPYLYIFLQKRAEAILLREQYRYQGTLKHAARELARIHKFSK